jgi:hypothetical protein
MDKIVGLILVLAAFEGSTAYKDSADVKIEFISAWSSNGQILVQTSPRYDISGLTCTDDYWLVLNKNEEGYQPALSLLMSAQASGAKVVVRADDSSGEQFCRLSRIITKPPES